MKSLIKLGTGSLACSYCLCSQYYHPIINIYCNFCALIKFDRSQSQSLALVQFFYSACLLSRYVLCPILQVLTEVNIWLCPHIGQGGVKCLNLCTPFGLFQLFVDMSLHCHFFPTIKVLNWIFLGLFSFALKA